ncbi:MAG: site-specific integrase, partial [Bosea sp. (in: a-proteobacteria)]
MSSPQPAQALRLFLDMLAAERGAATNTLDAYRRDVSDYLGFLQPKVALAKVSTSDVRDWLAELDARDLKSASVARRLSAVRQFHRFLYSDGHLEHDPTAALAGPKRGLVLPKVMSVADVDRLISTGSQACAVPGQTPPARLQALRMRALIELLYATGLRVSELVSLPSSAAT